MLAIHHQFSRKKRVGFVATGRLEVLAGTSLMALNYILRAAVILLLLLLAGIGPSAVSALVTTSRLCVPSRSHPPSRPTACPTAPAVGYRRPAASSPLRLPRRPARPRAGASLALPS